MLEDSAVHPSNWVAPNGLIVQRQPADKAGPFGHSVFLRFFFQPSVHALDLLLELGNHLGQL